MEDPDQASSSAARRLQQSGADPSHGGGRGSGAAPESGDAGAGGEGTADRGGSASATRAGAHAQKPPRTRTSAMFQALIAGAVILVFLLIFILENTEDVKINFLGAKGHLSLGVALLLAAVGGALIVAVVGAARIGQLRVHQRRQRGR
jgi:uncharacterized integral membrane protein